MKDRHHDAGYRLTSPIAAALAVKIVALAAIYAAFFIPAGGPTAPSVRAAAIFGPPAAGR